MQQVNVSDVVGLIGVACILAAYALLQIERIDAKGWRYSGINLLGAVLIIYSLFFTFNLSSFVIEICWMVISLYGLFKYFVGHKKLD